MIHPGQCFLMQLNIKSVLLNTFQVISYPRNLKYCIQDASVVPMLVAKAIIITNRSHALLNLRNSVHCIITVIF